MGRFNNAMAAKLAPTAPTVGKTIERLAPNELKKKKRLFKKTNVVPQASPLMKAFG